MDRKKIAKRYLSTWFIPEFISSFPFHAVVVGARCEPLKAATVTIITLGALGVAIIVIVTLSILNVLCGATVVAVLLGVLSCCNH